MGGKLIVFVYDAINLINKTIEAFVVNFVTLLKQKILALWIINTNRRQ
jgi:hypothetical protein